jgi:hypothetical protein
LTKLLATLLFLVPLLLLRPLSGISIPADVSSVAKNLLLLALDVMFLLPLLLLMLYKLLPMVLLLKAF